MKKKLKGILYCLLTFVSITTFKDKNGSYRLKGYAYIYQSSDYSTCHERKIILMPKIFANGVTGCGVCGSVTKYEDIKGISFNWKRFHYRSFDKHKWTIKELKDAWYQYKFLRSVPKNLTWKEYEEYALNYTVKAAMKSFKKH